MNHVKAYDKGERFLSADLGQPWPYFKLFGSPSITRQRGPGPDGPASSHSGFLGQSLTVVGSACRLT